MKGIAERESAAVALLKVIVALGTDERLESIPDADDDGTVYA
jgi:hypothetical protein